MVASYNGNVETTRMLLEHGSDVDRRNNRGQIRWAEWRSRVTKTLFPCCWNTARTLMPTTAVA
jgi:hypothetical protein